MNSRFKLTIFTFLLAAFSTSCSNPNFKISKSNFNGNRLIAYDDSSTVVSEMNPAYYAELVTEAQKKGHKVEFPPGFTNEDKSLMWHMSEGSEIFPSLWLMNMKSANSIYPNSPFLEKLDLKFGIIPDYLGDKSGYPMKWIGLTAAWSDEHPERQDIILEPNEELIHLPKVKKLENGKQSIAMTGVNCTFCHTGEMTYIEGGTAHRAVIEGAPGMIDPRGFFKDMYAATIKTMIDEELLLDLFKNMKVENAEEKAREFSKTFSKELGVEPTLKSRLVKILEKTPIIKVKIAQKKADEIKDILYSHRDLIHERLVKLLQVTYGFEKVPDVLVQRMKYFAKLGSANPVIEETAAGFGRTDAFGRIANEAVRGINPIALTAPVSLPYMYSIKYKGMYHYNANTNSVISRNIGQAFGLGAIKTNPEEKGLKQFASTANLHNLNTMEKILYKVKVPEFQAIFPNAKIDKVAAVKGCNIYLNKCMSCHDAPDTRVGPKRALINYNVVPLDVIGTDGNYIKNQATLVNGKPFRVGLYDFSDNVKKWYYKEYDVSEEKVNEWANSDLRGTEIFRDTFLGDNRFMGDEVMSYTAIEPGRGYVAKNLAGIWATSPFLHNGSVANVNELLLPSNKRRKVFVVGSHVYDNKNMGFTSDKEAHPDGKIKSGSSTSKESLGSLCKNDSTRCYDASFPGNSNVGHEPSMYGGELVDVEKKQLIEFLKVLRPESEYAWTSTPMYKINNQKCEIR